MRDRRSIALWLLLVALDTALLIAALNDHIWPVAVLAALSYVADQALLANEDRRLIGRLRAVGADAMWRSFYRLLLVVVFLVRPGELGRDGTVMLVVCVTLRQVLLGLRAGLALLIDRRRLRRVETRNLPVLGEELPPPLQAWIGGRRGGRLQSAGEVALLVGLIVTAATGRQAVVLVGALVMAVIALLFTAALVPQLVALLRLPRNEDRLVAAQDAVRALQPLVILYFSGGTSAIYQANMWFETLERLDRPALILLRERRYLDRLAPTSVPILCLPFTSDLMNFEFTGAKVALYVANVGRNIHLLRVPYLKSAFIGHGDSDKVASFNPYSKVYDEVWVAGEAGRERYLRANVGVRSDEIVVVGRPQLDKISESRTRPEGAPFVVLYAPTWEGWTADPFASSLVESGVPIVRTLLETPGVAVIFKPHPLSGTVQPAARAAEAEISALIAAAGPPHRTVGPDGPPLYECFDESDAMISDISSVVSDYLRSDKPYFVTNGAGRPDAEFRELNPSAAAAYLVGPGGAGLAEGLAAARTDDPRRADRQATRRHLLGDPDIESIVLFRAAVDALAAKAPDAPETAPAPPEPLHEAEGSSDVSAESLTATVEGD